MKSIDNFLFVHSPRSIIDTRSLQQSSLATIPARLCLAVVQWLLKLIRLRKTVQGPMHCVPQKPPLLAPYHQPEMTTTSPKASTGIRRRRKRTKGSKSRAAASKRAGKHNSAKRHDSESIRTLPEEAMFHPARTDPIDHVKSAARKEEAPRPDQMDVGWAGGRHGEEKTERTRAGCHQRADTETRRTIRLEKGADEVQPQVRHFVLVV